MLFKIIFLSFFISISLCANTINLTKEEKEYLDNKSYISVMGLENFQPFSFLQNGKFSGYSIETMNLIGTILNKEINYINKPWAEQLQMLKDGKLDVIPHLAVTKKRKEFADYTDFNHLTFLIGFAVNKNTHIYSMKDFEGKKIAVVNKYFLHDHLKKRFPNIELLVTNSTQEAVDAVAKNKAFAVIDNIPTLNYFIEERWLTNLRVFTVNDLGLGFETKMPMAVTKGNELLKSILEKANDTIPHIKKSRLKQKWMHLEEKKEVSHDLNTHEIAYLKKKKKILMCVLPNWLPFEQIDENGQHKGIGADFMKIVSRYIDTPIELLPTKEWSESLQNIRDKKCDILPVAMDIPSRRDVMNFTKPYVAEPFVIATKSDKFFIKDANELSFKKIGIVKSYAFIEVLKNKNPDIQIVNVANTQEGLEKVQNGELFGYIDTMPTIGYYIQKYSMIDLKVAGRLEFDIELSVASRNDEPLLNSIMQKALDTISQEERRTIIGRWISIKVSQEFDYTLLWQIVVFFVMILFAIVYRNRVIYKTNKKIEEQQSMVNKYVLISTTDLDGIITDINEAYCKTIGYEKSELVGKTYRNIKHPDMQRKFFRQLWKTLHNNKAWSGEIKNVSRSGKTLHFHVNIEPIFKNKEKIGYRSICENITDRKKIEELSITDQLTQLYNRFKIETVFDLEIARVKRYGTDLSIILLDIDYFKSVNDNYGHDVGDMTLQSIAKILKKNIRGTDVVGRWGGEEFIIIVPNSSREETYELAQKIRKKMEVFCFEKVGQKTSSFGVSTFKENDTKEKLIKRADLALYEAKKNGRNRVEVG